MDWLFPTALSLGLVSLLALIASPVVGMAAVFMVKPFVDAAWGQPILGSFLLTEVYSGLVSVILLGHMALAKEDDGVGRMPLKWMWLAYSIYIFIFSTIIAHNDELKSGANIFFRYINGLIGFYVLQAFFRQGNRLKWFLLALLIGGLFPMGLGIYQAATGVQWRVEQAEGLARSIGIWHDSVNMRTYAQQTLLGLLLYSALYVRTWKIPLKVVALSYLAVSTIVMMKVYSKAAMFTTALWVICWTLLRRQFVALAACGVIAMLVTTYYADDLADKIATLFHKEVGFFSGEVEGRMTFHGRWFDWEQMIRKWDRLPTLSQWFGSGEIATGAHNDFLQMLFHGGIVGVAIYISLLILIGIRITANLFARADEMAVAALMVYLMWLVDSVGLVPSAYPAEQWLVWGLIGLSFRLRADEARQHLIRESEREEVVQDSLIGNPALATVTASRRFPLLSD